MELADPLRPRQIELLNELEALFFAEGYRTSSMAELAQRLKCSKRALYECAPSRKELFVLIVTRWSRRVRELGLAAETATLDPRERLIAYLAPGVTETKAITGAFLTDLRDLPAARQILSEHQQERMDHLKKILDAGVAAKAFKNIHSHLVAGVCFAGIERINDPDFLKSSGLNYSEAFSELYRTILNGIQA